MCQCPSTSVPDFFLHNISSSFSPMSFKFTDLVPGQDLELINFSWLWLNFEGHRGLLGFKINIVYAILPSVSPLAFKFTDMSMDKTLNWLTFYDYGSILKVTGGHYVSKLTLFMQYFLVFHQWLSNSQISDHRQDLELIHFSWLWLNFHGTGGHYVSKLTLFMWYFM